jgi:hypothetical protein
MLWEIIGMTIQDDILSVKGNIRQEKLHENKNENH